METTRLQLKMASRLTSKSLGTFQMESETSSMMAHSMQRKTANIIGHHAACSVATAGTKPAAQISACIVAPAFATHFAESVELSIITNRHGISVLSVGQA